MEKRLLDQDHAEPTAVFRRAVAEYGRRAPTIRKAAAPPLPTSAPPPADPEDDRETLSPEKPRRRLLGWSLGVAVGVIALGSVPFIPGVWPLHPRQTTDAVVRISSGDAAGTGFFVDGPDDALYAVTAFHVVSGGDRVLVAREIETSPTARYTEAYPDVEVAAFDADSDVAILRVNNVRKQDFVRLRLAAAPVPNEPISSYGFPASSLTKTSGLLSLEGKVLNRVKFPVVDWRNGRVVRENATDGMLVSTNIEPGFSGGPSCNAAGEVVGINVLKDRAHTGQNGAVSVEAVKRILTTVKGPARDASTTPAEVGALLAQVQRDYLQLPLNERANTKEEEFLSALDLPALRRTVRLVRQIERDTDRSYDPERQLSGQASIGLLFSRLPGPLLETYSAVRGPLATCEERVARGGLTDPMTAARDVCEEMAIRPMAWDLVASTLQWEGSPKDLVVTKLERPDEDIPAWRASVKVPGATSLVEVWVAKDQGRLRLKLFDNGEHLYVTTTSHDVPAASFQGIWHLSTPPKPEPGTTAILSSTSETLSVVSERMDHVTIHHEFARDLTAPGLSLECVLRQDFEGRIENGAITATQTNAALNNAHCKSLVDYAPDHAATFKRLGAQLQMYRTDGVEFPKLVTFDRQQ